MAEIWAKFTKNERNVSFGAAIVIIGWLVGVVSPGLGSGFGVGFLSALGAVAVIAIYYLKYAPNQNIQWPAPIETIVLAISALIALFAVLGLIQILGYLSIAGFLGIYFIALLAITAGAVLMFFGAWQEYQATAAKRAAAAPPTAAPTAAAPSAPAASAPPAAPAAPAAPPPAAPAPPAGDDGAPPA
jgi:small-conductance mechanosensitive channel